MESTPGGPPLLLWSFGQGQNARHSALDACDDYTAGFGISITVRMEQITRRLRLYNSDDAIHSSLAASRPTDKAVTLLCAGYCVYVLVMFKQCSVGNVEMVVRRWLNATPSNRDTLCARHCASAVV